ncbi:GNAT family N-acetyltransferase [Vibrio furnissii]|uniref:GNAT family N-acetyltransferase n=1 Tax=Vibrio furnissii TaxID=29494 RepID=UPI0022B11870|nr:GNAT family N-acetyltransferase [Vibrio furnissii]
MFRKSGAYVVTIREMDISDYDAVIAIWRETEHLSLRDVDSRDSIAAYLARNAGCSFVAIKDGVIVGTVLAGTDGRRGYLQHLAVSSRLRGQGIGERLVDATVDALAALGIHKTHLFVYHTNHSAQGFYQKLGWCARDEVRMFSFNGSEHLNA